MITIYYQIGNGIEAREFRVGDELPESMLWMDILHPTKEEEQGLEMQLDIELPTKDEVWKNHSLNRFFKRDGVSYMTALIINKSASSHPITSPISFILVENFLITIRYVEPTSFKNFIGIIPKTSSDFKSGQDVLEGLVEEIITRIVHNLELVIQELDDISHSIYGGIQMENKDYNPEKISRSVLYSLGSCADLNSKINESATSIARMLSFFKEAHVPDEVLDSEIRTLTSDVEAIMSQSNFYSNKISFQLDAILGMINIEQNIIIKIISILSVFFMPATLVSSIYGMNFEQMPELKWTLGYPYSLGIIALTSLASYLYFKKKNWL